MALQARRVQIIIARNLITRLAPSKPSVNFSPLDMLTCTAFSCHDIHLTHYHSLKAAGGGISETSRYRNPSRNHIGMAIAAIAIPFEWS